MPGAPTMQQQPQILQQRQELERQLLERQLQGVQTPRRGVEDDNDQDGYGGGSRTRSQLRSSKPLKMLWENWLTGSRAMPMLLRL
jgi:hypothetical protein